MQELPRNPVHDISVALHYFDQHSTGYAISMGEGGLLKLTGKYTKESKENGGRSLDM